MSYQLIRADARALPLADNTVDLVVTSPPYFALRSYQDDGQHMPGQLGDEPTVAEYVAALVDCTREMVRVLKPSGSLWINVGDKYVADTRGTDIDTHRGVNGQPRAATGGPRKSLMGTPWRYAIACVDELGLTLRAEVVWSKPNAMPESVRDRVGRVHETWFHFTLGPRYYSAVDLLREPHRNERTVATAEKPPLSGFSGGSVKRGADAAKHLGNPLGALPGSVWEVPTVPLKVPKHLGVKHYAPFPPELPRRIIAGWCPERVCTGCGQGRVPVVEHTRTLDRAPVASLQHRADGVLNVRYRSEHRITGESCACPTPNADTTHAVVLDPFSGTGTTALVADVHGRHGIGVDLSADYQRLRSGGALTRSNGPAPRAGIGNRPGWTRPACQPCSTTRRVAPRWSTRPPGREIVTRNHTPQESTTMPRKSTFTDPKVFQLRIEAELLQRVTVRAAELGVSRSDVIRAAIADWVNRPPVEGSPVQAGDPEDGPQLEAYLRGGDSPAGGPAAGDGGGSWRRHLTVPPPVVSVRFEEG